MKLVLVSQDAVEIAPKGDFRHFDRGDAHFSFQPSAEDIEALKAGQFLVLRRPVNGDVYELAVAPGPREHKLVGPQR